MELIYCAYLRIIYFRGILTIVFRGPCLTFFYCMPGTKGVILTGQTRLQFGSVWFSSVHFGRMRGLNHVRFTLV